MKRAEWREAEQKRRESQSNQIRTKLQCSLSSTLFYSALPMRILNCLSTVSDLKKVGLLKSLISHYLPALPLPFLLSRIKERVPSIVLKVHSFSRVYFSRWNWHESEKSMRHCVCGKVFDDTPDTGTVLSPNYVRLWKPVEEFFLHTRCTCIMQIQQSPVCSYNPEMWRLQSETSPSLTVCVSPIPAAHLAKKQRNQWSASAEGRLHWEKDCG